LPSTNPPERRAPVTRDRILRAAIDLADEGGLDAISMRKLGQALGVEAMSLYKHVANKDEVLDGMAELVMEGVEVPDPALPWREAIRRSEISAHRALRSHAWASALIESRMNAGPVRLRYLDAVIATLRAAGFPLHTVAYAFMTLDSYTYGFTLHEQAWTFEPDEAPEVAAAMAELLPADVYPNVLAVAALAAGEGGAMPIDFEFGLDLILDGLERLLSPGRRRTANEERLRSKR
jgi:AcrR family transcriptional regulator